MSNSLPGVIAKEKNVILPVNKYKLPAWSHWVLQLAFKAKHASKLTPQLMVAAEIGDVKWSPEGPWLVNLSLTTATLIVEDKDIWVIEID